MKYRKFIEDWFLIDMAQTGELVPFKFNKVQVKYYDELCRDYDIENNGISTPVRENILKARREGFSSLVLALFAADDIYQPNPTETSVLSYKDDATAIFRKRYRTFILSYFIRWKLKKQIVHIKNQPGLLDEAAEKFLSVDATDIELKHNRAHFYCGTASARVGGRGGVLQKLLFSEIAYYPDSEKQPAKEVIEGTMRQVDVEGGWVFAESTENGRGTYQYKMWQNSKAGLSRFKNRFYGAGEFYTPEELAKIKLEFVDMDMFRREYPMTEQDLFASSISSFTTESDLLALQEIPHAKREVVLMFCLTGTNYIDQCEMLRDMLESMIEKYPRNALYAGIDVAKQHDKTTLIVLRDKGLALNPGLKCLSIDSTGAGDFMPDWFERNTRFYLERVKFSRVTKDIMYRQLTVVIKEQLTALPLLIENGEYTSDEAKMFFNEMVELQKKIVGRLMVVEHPNSEDAHDDFPDAWALAEHSVVVIHGVEKRVKPETVENVPDAVGRLLNRNRDNRAKVVDSEYL